MKLVNGFQPLFFTASILNVWWVSEYACIYLAIFNTIWANDLFKVYKEDNRTKHKHVALVSLLLTLH